MRTTSTEQPAVFPRLDSGPYAFTYSESSTDTESFVLTGGTGVGYLRLGRCTQNKHWTGGAWGDASITGAFSGDTTGGRIPVNFVDLAGPFFFGQPFQVVVSVTASGNVPEGLNGMSTFSQSQSVNILGVTDAAGNPIAGASLVQVSQVPEPSTFALLLVCGLALGVWAHGRKFLIGLLCVAGTRARGWSQPSRVAAPPTARPVRSSKPKSTPRPA